MIGKTRDTTRSSRSSARAGWARYRASDAKLGREVPIKVLPEAFARGAERLALTSLY